MQVNEKSLKNEIKPLPGFKNLVTDSHGMEKYEALQRKALSIDFNTEFDARRYYRQQGMILLEGLKQEGRLWRRNDGTRVT